MLFLSEIVLRLLHNSRPQNEFGLNTLLRKSTVPGLQWELTPGFTSEKYTINSQGFRGVEFTVNKDSSVKRIACIGDSHCFGLGVYEDARIYPSLLQEKLSTQQRVEVLNFGVPGYNTWQEFSQLQNVVLELKPDIVILGFFFNDSDGNTRITTKDGIQSLRSQNPVAQSTSYTSWLKQSRLVLALKEVFEIGVLALFDYHPNYIDLKIKTERWSEMKSMLAQMASLLREKQIQFLVVVFPMTYQLTAPESESAAQQDILSFLQEQQIDFINLFPRFRQFLQQNDFDYKKLIVKGIRDSHPTAAGHALTAEAIVKYFQSMK